MRTSHLKGYQASFIAAMLLLFTEAAWAGQRQPDIEQRQPEDWQRLAPGVTAHWRNDTGGERLSVRARGAEGREWMVKNLFEPALERAQQLLDSHDGDSSALRARVDALRSRIESVRPGGGLKRPLCYVILNPGISFFNGNTYSSANGAVNTCDSTFVWADAYAYIGNSLGTNGAQMYRYDEGLGYAEALASVSTQGTVPCAFADDFVDDGDFLYYDCAQSGLCSFANCL